MTGTRPGDLGVEDWLLALVTALDQHELLTIGVRICAAGHARTLARCLRCAGQLPPMTLPGLVRHLRETEAAHRAEHANEDGPNAALHGPGDLVPAGTAPRTSR